MRIACVGGGPGGLYFAALMKGLGPGHEVTVYERNAPGDAFGFGVVLSDETLGGIEHADPEVYAALSAEFARWDDIDVHYRGTVTTSGGHGFSAVDRRRLLGILRDRCTALGVDLRLRTEAPPAEELERTHDVVVACDGAGSATRTAFAGDFGTTLERRHCRYMWLATDKVFDAFNFHVVETPYGVMQAHAYPYSDGASTFIAEMHEDVWRAAGFDAPGRPTAPDGTDLEAVERCADLFADALEGHTLIPNASRWRSFTTVRNRTWRRGATVLLGDAAHTAHFSIGSGTKLAMEDALALAACLHEHDGVKEALAAYEEERRPVAESVQRAAQASLEWFEDMAMHVGQEPKQFAFNLLTRSRRVGRDNLRLRDPDFADAVDDWFGRANGGGEARPPMFHPFRLRGLELKNRVVVSAMDMYSSEDGTPGDFHLVHLGSKALGGAGLVMTEMVCVSAPGRITPGCAGLYAPEHTEAWRRVTDFVHERSTAAIGVQLGHSGRKGATRLMWEGIDEPLEEGEWPIVAPSPLPYREGVNQVPEELTHDGMDRIRDAFVHSAREADRAGFDLLELHCAHGYLLSSFLSPVTNRRTDRYGGDLQGRLRYPLEVFAAVREVWPDHKPLTVRISATDWVEGGTTGEDAVEIARAFAEAGADAIDVSTGQVTPDEQPAYGRSFQVPFAERIRARVDVPVVAVGAISSYDDVNSLLLAGRADLCALGRTHLYDPQWTLHAAAEQEYSGPGAQWPVQFKAGSRRPPTGRTDGPRPRLELLRSPDPGPAHRRWRPQHAGGPRTA
ncbi:bifunctional salicylyl-CoA 5-hydroxylase/oxidoreductase [Nocardiopsis suaedae]|uniref:Bifunctional salicylyl-CoA 5-hydroxylase/oxidoreductase n=1 Tax=Nocardiopsis suaedae TaxID=3018444 RepID=A0ABT4TLE3_9ACTN|nr:bifunctional salicylyl-CoA 5-hydroxylase/oxidoreductase [Nocardiopsis suaedae]MDA2805508.1 bifunctional salicylyl-CoA 5-hydroxylase/oxidoreductase [Nocardiopsis suaedae]